MSQWTPTRSLAKWLETERISAQNEARLRRADRLARAGSPELDTRMADRLANPFEGPAVDEGVRPRIWAPAWERRHPS
jgi:hypothetical protein